MKSFIEPENLIKPGSAGVGEGTPTAAFTSGVSAAGAACWLHTVSAPVLLPNQGVSLSCAGMPVVLSQEVESVLVGAAILGACASGDFASVQVCEDQGVGHGPSPSETVLPPDSSSHLAKHIQDIIKK